MILEHRFTTRNDVIYFSFRVKYELAFLSFKLNSTALCRDYAPCTVVDILQVRHMIDIAFILARDRLQNPTPCCK